MNRRPIQENMVAHAPENLWNHALATLMDSGGDDLCVHLMAQEQFLPATFHKNVFTGGVADAFLLY
jgi:hypothetical protein